MTLSAEKELKHIGESCGCADHDHDLMIGHISGRLRCTFSTPGMNPGAQGFGRKARLRRAVSVVQPWASSDGSPNNLLPASNLFA